MLSFSLSFEVFIQFSGRNFGVSGEFSPKKCLTSSKQAKFNSVEISSARAKVRGALMQPKGRQHSRRDMFGIAAGRTKAGRALPPVVATPFRGLQKASDG